MNMLGYYLGAFMTKFIYIYAQGGYSGILVTGMCE